MKNIGDYMNWDFLEISKSFIKDNKGNLLVEGKFGVEKESQRITSSGDLALTAHPHHLEIKQKIHELPSIFLKARLK